VDGEDAATLANLTSQRDNNWLSKYATDLQPRLKAAEAKRDSKIQDIVEKIDTIKRGSWLFDPTKIDKDFYQQY
jgi:hypothetical protein